MKTAVAETSLDAFRTHRGLGHAERQCDKIFALLQKHPMGLTNREIGDSLRIPASTVSPRIGELIAQGKVEYIGKRKCSKGSKRAQVHGVAS